MFKKKKQRPMTLLEIMIVIFIIGIIGSVIGYNMKGSLEEGKAFKTQEGIKQLYEIFHLEMAKGSASIDDVRNDSEKVLKHSRLVRNPKKLLLDGWGEPYKITYKRDLHIYSKKYSVYLAKKGIKGDYPWEVDDGKA